MKIIHALVRAFEGPRGYALCILLAGLIALPTLWAGIFVDDYVHLYTIEDGEYTPGTKWDIFCFAPGNAETMKEYIARGPFPWYTFPEINLHFFRPLSSALMTFDNMLFGRNFFFYHAHSILWYLALAWIVSRIFRRSLPGGLGVLALAIYVLDEGHFIPVGWWSNRNALNAVVPALFGFVAHLRWREEGWRPGLPLSLLGYGIGFLGGEAALGVMGYLGAYELLGDRHALRSRITALVPAAVLSLGFLAVYKFAGFGVKGSDIYLDPMDNTLGFLAQAPGRMLQLIGTHFAMLPVEASALRPGIDGFMTVSGLVILLVVLGALRLAWPSIDPESRHGMRWLVTGALFSAAPVLATFPSGRLLLLPSIGGAAVIAIIIRAWWQSAKARPLLRGTAIAFVAMHLLLPWVIWPTASALVRVIQERSERAIAETEIDAGRESDLRVVVLAAPDPYLGFYPMIVRRVNGGDISKSWQTLSVAPCVHRVVRTGENSLELETVDGEMLGTLFERLFRPAEPRILEGDRFASQDFTVTIVATNGEWPTRIRVDFATSLDDPGRWFLTWEGDHLAKFTFPPIGEPVDIENTGGLVNLKFLLDLE